ncbi:hypothetical protein AURDEDRAFT_177529 [Auricularia subglabra TFB-10046 SS5]|uniref:F-box domain-containing protein n=1 Tax=Auricularia subglabra (strain TFB-10046 / SS5) TaxID=717982 RepID=J0D3W9_AURST|nr:hypothetical protein AURDEDRAFT_177529 [Auricularia subglabra TFB-10046 SS5]
MTSTTGIKRFPDELLLEFFATLSTPQRVTASGVCHRWRHVSLGSPNRLWSRVTWDGQSCAQLAFLLRRAEPAAQAYLSLEIHPPVLERKDDFSAFLAVVRQHLWHVATLEVTMFACGYATPAGSWLFDGLRAPAPLLVEFSVIFTTSGGALCPPLDLFGATAPCLRSIRFDSSCLALPQGLPPAFSAVSHLRCEGDWESTSVLLALFPVLESVHITSRDHLLHSVEDVARHSPPPESLVTVTLQFPAPGSTAANFMRYFSFTGIQTLHLNYSLDLFEGIRLCGFPGGTVLRRLSVASDPTAPLQTGVIAHCTGDNSRVVILHNLPAWHQWPAWLFSDVADVTVHEDLWVSVPIVLRSATTLNLTLRPAITVDCETEDVLTVFDWTQLRLKPMLDCPALHSVTVLGNGRATSYQEIADFLTLGIARRSPTLKLLWLKNVAIEENPAVDPALTLYPLYQLASHIDISHSDTLSTLESEWKAPVAAQLVKLPRQSKHAGDNAIDKILLDTTLLSEARAELKPAEAQLQRKADKLTPREVDAVLAVAEQTRRDIAATRARGGHRQPEDAISPSPGTATRGRMHYKSRQRQGAARARASATPSEAIGSKARSSSGRTPTKPCRAQTKVFLDLDDYDAAVEADDTSTRDVCLRFIESKLRKALGASCLPLGGDLSLLGGGGGVPLVGDLDNLLLGSGVFHLIVV